MRHKSTMRPKKPTPYDPWAMRTWDEVAEEFNRRQGTHLTRARIMQIGRTAEMKLKQLAAAISGGGAGQSDGRL